MCDVCFCFLTGNPTKHNQLHLVWKSVAWTRWIPKDWVFFSLWRSCFNISVIWRYLRSVVLSDSGICLTISRAFYLHAECQQYFQDREELQIIIRYRPTDVFIACGCKLFSGKLNVISFTTLFPKGESCHQWLSRYASKNAFDLFWWVFCCYFKLFWDVLEPIITTKCGCTKQAMHWTIQIQHFSSNAMKSTWD